MGIVTDASTHNGTFGDLFTALCALAWLTALYSIIQAFLHFYLFFSLNLPFTHLLDQGALLAPNGAPGKTTEQAEVDIRVRCEKPPFESMEWVWWAWWAHRRSPVGHIFAVLTGVLALASVGLHHDSGTDCSLVSCLRSRMVW